MFLPAPQWRAAALGCCLWTLRRASRDGLRRIRRRPLHLELPGRRSLRGLGPGLPAGLHRGPDHLPAPRGALPLLAAATAATPRTSPASRCRWRASARCPSASAPARTPAAPPTARIPSASASPYRTGGATPACSPAAWGLPTRRLPGGRLDPREPACPCRSEGPTRLLPGVRDRRRPAGACSVGGSYLPLCASGDRLHLAAVLPALRALGGPACPTGTICSPPYTVNQSAAFFDGVYSLCLTPCAAGGGMGCPAAVEPPRGASACPDRLRPGG